MSPKDSKRDLRQMFLNLQKQMIAQLGAQREVITHPTAKGDASELRWLEMLKKYLPKRYELSKAFVVDCTGDASEQIDIVVYDQQYSPFLFHEAGAIFVPAESVYAVFEVKQDLNRTNIEYAGKKAESVRRLKRTSAPVPYVKGKYPPKKLFHIIAGIIALGCDWKERIGANIENACNRLSQRQIIELGCSLQYGAFEARYGETFKADVSKPDDSLIFFFLRLLNSLQQVGTTPAIDISKYSRALNE